MQPTYENEENAAIWIHIQYRTHPLWVSSSASASCEIDHTALNLTKSVILNYARPRFFLYWKKKRLFIKTANTSTCMKYLFDWACLWPACVSLALSWALAYISIAVAGWKSNYALCGGRFRLVWGEQVWASFSKKRSMELLKTEINAAQ